MSTDAYEAPIEDILPQRGWRAPLVWGIVLGSAASGVGGIFVTAEIGEGRAEPLLLGLAVMLLGWLISAPLGLILGLMRPWSPPTVLGAIVGAGLSATTVGLGGFFMLFARGRQLREDGELKFAPVGEGDDWTPGGGSVAVPEALRTPLAEAWRQNGLTEHASVAAFARLSLELVALGAPPELLVDAARDGIDEIRHTEGCFGLARALDGQLRSPGPLPEASTAGALRGTREERLDELAVASLVDGALNEGASARILARLWPQIEDERVREMVRRIAADEGRHAAHGWAVVEWCLAVGGERVRSALIEAAAAIPDRIHSPHPPESRDGSWHRYGIAGAELDETGYAETVVQTRRKVAVLVGFPSGRSPPAPEPMHAH